MAASLAAGQMNVMTAAPAPAGQQTHTVTVGGVRPVATGVAPILGYFPESIVAAQGDVVQFVFMQKNHTVTQSTFEKPCNKKEGGLDSGFMPNPEGKPGVTWNMTVDTTEPLWFYCKQRTGVHCGVGMVFSINPKQDSDKTMAAFKQLAIKINGTDAKPLQNAPIQNVQPNANAAPSTVTILAGGDQPPSQTGAAGAAATTAIGQGIGANGQACSCSCLCGINSFPQQAAIGSFGGFAGMLG